MNNNPDPSKTKTLNERKCNTTILSKLRRLKIEENLLFQSLKKHDQIKNDEFSESDASNDVDCENIIKTINDSYMNIKNLFDDIKTITNSQELLAELEIDEIKKKVLELETTMKSYLSYLSTKLSSLKNAEQEIIKELEELNFKDAHIKKHAKISSTIFKKAVPSPVRLLMTVPLKCPEVQEFQDFMKNSPNRCGGWNEYHHNIFVKLWQKHFGGSNDTEYNDYIDENLALDNFVEESLYKLQGIDKRNLISHTKWFKEYLSLKSKQQTAIDTWKSSRRPSRRVSADNQVFVQNVGNRQRSKCVKMKHKLEPTKSVQKCLSAEDIERVMAPTKQWLSRCEVEQKSERIPLIEHLEKLRIPNWRKYL